MASFGGIPSTIGPSVSYSFLKSRTSLVNNLILDLSSLIILAEEKGKVL
jgi:hypothetical protein